MSGRTARRIAWTSAAVAWLAGVFTLILGSSMPPGARPLEMGSQEAALADAALSWILPTVGAVIASHRPRNPIGWLLLGSGLISALDIAAGEWAVHALFVGSSPLGSGHFAAVFHQIMWMVSLTTLPLAVLIFPDGKLPSRRWLPAATIACIPTLIVLPLFAIAWTLRPRPLLTGERLPDTGIVDPLIGAAILCALVGLLAALVALVQRYRRGTATQRQQIKWVVVAAALLVTDGVTGSFQFIDAVWRDALSSLAFNLIPIAMAVAILRYRLYDIDRVINRTIVYALVTGLLAGAYAGLVLLLQGLLPVDSRSPLIVAASTLAVVGLFRPLRVRIQELVDRRFYRSRYDTQNAVESFGSRLRAQTNIDELSSDLASVVTTTLRPSHVSLWLSGVQTARGERAGP